MTEHVTLNTDTISCIADAIDAVGSSQFPGLFVEICASILGADSSHLSAFFANARPVELFSTRDEPDEVEVLSLYLDVGFVLDPFYQLFLTDGRDRIDRLSKIAPDDFRRSDYYTKFFKPLNLSDECGLMITYDRTAALFLSMGAHGSKKMPLERLKVLLPALAALARRHWTVLTPERFEGTGRLAAQLEAAFVSFGNSRLSPKEGKITRMILQGHSSKSIAIALNNSPETIKVHRKRIYAKLDVSSQGELLSLFLHALRHMPAGAKGDPLSYVQQGSGIPRQGD